MTTSTSQTPYSNIIPASAGRLFFIAVFFLVLLTPAMVQMSGKFQDASMENRVLAARPGLPHSLPQVHQFPAEMDGFLNDHFGLRSSMVEWNNKLRYHLLGDIGSVQLTAGKDGHLFFNSHAASAPLAMVYFLCGKNVSAEYRAEIVKSASGFMHMALQLAPHSHLLIAPTKPAVYADQLPDWLQWQCNHYTATVPAVIAAMQAEPSLSKKVVYPLAEMQALRPKVEAFPKNNFHWTGQGSQPVARLLAEQYMQRQRISRLPGVMRDMPSDVQHFLPGVALNVAALEPDYASAGVIACDGVACFPEFAGVADQIGFTTRYRRPGTKGPKLLLITDSFGIGIAGFFSEYFGEVWHVSMNNIKLLTPEQRLRFKQILFQDYAPDEVLYVFHDAAIAYFDQQAAPLLLPDSTAAK